MPGFGVRGVCMRGRKPEGITISPLDIPELERIAHSEMSPWYQVQRARIVLGIAAGQRREFLAAQLECDESTIWRTCQRYRYLGLAGLLADHRQGHSGRVHPQNGFTQLRRNPLLPNEVAAWEA